MDTMDLGMIALMVAALAVLAVVAPRLRGRRRQGGSDSAIITNIGGASHGHKKGDASDSDGGSGDGGGDGGGGGD